MTHPLRYSNRSGLIVLMILPLFTLMLSGSLFAADPLAQEGIDRYGNAGAIKGKMYNPLVSPSTPMQTFRENSSFNAQVACPSSNKFLTVSASESSTGDIDVTLQQDTNFDNALDYTYTVKGVSVVCANGIGVCAPGTASNCNYSKWSVNGIKVALTPVPSITSLGGCSCINNSCLPTRNMQNILMGLGGGAVGALQTAYQQYSVSAAASDAASISYYGQDTSRCGGQMYAGNSGLTNYYNNPGTLSADAQTAALGSPADSVYGTVLKANTTTKSGVVTCSITRNAVLSPNTQEWAMGGSSSAALNNEYVWVKIDYPAGSSTMTFQQGIGVTPGTWTNLGTVNMGNTTGATVTYQLSTALTSSSVPSVLACNGSMVLTSPNISTQVNSTACTGSLSYTYSYDVKVTTNVVVENIVDGCVNYANDPNCKLSDETVDSTTTYTNGQSTGAVVPTSCKSISGTNVCEPWWNKSRNYYCTPPAGSAAFDPKALTAGASAPGKTASYDLTGTGTLQYKDISGIPQSYSLYKTTPSSTCNKACKVQTAATNTQVSTTGSTSAYLSSTNTSNYKMLICTGPNNDTCPNSPGETVVSPCGCQNEFGQAASSLNALFQAGKDIICSGP